MIAASAGREPRQAATVSSARESGSEYRPSPVRDPVAGVLEATLPSDFTSVDPGSLHVRVATTMAVTTMPRALPPIQRRRLMLDRHADCRPESHPLAERPNRG